MMLEDFPIYQTVEAAFLGLDVKWQAALLALVAYVCGTPIKFAARNGVKLVSWPFRSVQPPRLVSFILDEINKSPFLVGKKEFSVSERDLPTQVQTEHMTLEYQDQQVGGLKGLLFRGWLPWRSGRNLTSVLTPKGGEVVSLLSRKDRAMVVKAVQHGIERTQVMERNNKTEKFLKTLVS